MNGFASEVLEVIGELKQIINLKDKELSIAYDTNKMLQSELKALRDRINNLLSDTLGNV